MKILRRWRRVWKAGCTVPRLSFFVEAVFAMPAVKLFHCAAAPLAADRVILQIEPV